MRARRPSAVTGIRRWPALAALAAFLSPAAAQNGLPPGPDAAQGMATCTTECHQDLAAKKHLHGPVRQGCTACHIQVGEEGHTFSLILPKRELCLKCHSAYEGKSVHAPAAKGECLDCHDAHGSDRRRLLVADVAKDLCLKCHQDDFARHEFVHGPIATGACIVCHEPHASPRLNLLSDDATALCLTCHGEIQTEPDGHRHVHAALQEGCTKCHSPHASDHRFQLHAQAPELCLTCHSEHMAQRTQGAKVVHAAITEPRGCTTCHEPHSSTMPSLQRGSQPGTCLVCHDASLKAKWNSGLTDMAALLAENPDHHGPIREGACTACHDPHAGPNFRLLTEEYPAEFYARFDPESFALCFKCHIPDLVLTESGRGLTGFRDGDRNLHWLHVNQEKGRTCRACHEVHASQRPFHIRESVPFGTTGWMLELNFIASEEGGSCAPACHKPKSYDRTLPPPKRTPAGAQGARR